MKKVGEIKLTSGAVLEVHSDEEAVALTEEYSFASGQIIITKAEAKDLLKILEKL